MSEQNIFYLRPLILQEAFEKWLEMAAALFGGQNISASFSTNINVLQVHVQTIAHSLREHPEVNKFFNSINSNLFGVECIQFNVQAHNANPSISFNYGKKSDSLFATLTFNNSSNSDILIGQLKKLSQIFTFSEKSKLILSEIPNIQKDSLQQQEFMLAQLREETSKIAQFNLEQGKALTSFLTKATADLEERSRLREAEFNQKRQLIENDIKAREESQQEQHKQKLTELERREDEHKRRVEEIDARENMVVRRQLLGQITTLIAGQAEFTLSQSVSEKRKAVRNTCLLAMAGAFLWLVVCVAYILSLIANKIEPKWYQYTPLSIGAAFLISTIIYYLRWSDQWAREHAQAEIRNKKLNTDILRASWLAEMFFEGKDKDHLLPDMLLSRFSEGLFVESSANAPEHPTDQMVELLKKISSVKVSKEAVEVTKSAAEEKK